MNVTTQGIHPIKIMTPQMSQVEGIRLMIAPAITTEDKTTYPHAAIK
jgi:hypothetical protein